MSDLLRIALPKGRLGEKVYQMFDAAGYSCPEILSLLKKYEVRRCFYGHLHGGSHRLAIQGMWDGIDFQLVSADYLDFHPFKVIS